jgi:ABC-type glutathione transport system ATPase component
LLDDNAKVTNVFCPEHHKRASPTNSPNSPPSQQPESQPHLDLGNAPEIFNFYGRTAELATLEQWIIEERSRLVGIFGLGGMGKTTLALRLLEQIKPHFEYVIYRNLHFYANLNDILANLLTIFSPNSQIYDRPEKQISQLIDYLRESRCLIVLDNEDWSDRQQSRRFFKAIANVTHQSCVLARSNQKTIGDRLLG